MPAPKHITSTNTYYQTGIPSILLFEIRDFLFWWYIQMPLLYILSFRRALIVLEDRLSIGLLIRTFFTPFQRTKSWWGYTLGILIRIIYLPLSISIVITVTSVYTLLIMFWVGAPMLTTIMIILAATKA